MYISREFERALDLKKVLGDYGVQFVENTSHLILKKCPTCGGRNKFMIDRKTKMWVCFKCVETDNFQNKQGRGNLLTLFRDKMGLSPQEIASIVQNGEVLNFTDSDMFTRPSIQEEEKTLQQIIMPQSAYQMDATPQSVRQFPQAYSYLIKRHVTDPKVYRAFDLRYDPSRMRVIFPVYLDRMMIVGWQGRDITERWKQNHPRCSNFECPLKSKYYFIGEEINPINCPSCGEPLEMSHYPKSHNSTNFPKSSLFFNQHNVDWQKPVAIVEGPFDCVNTPNSIGMLGKSISKEQLNILIERAKDIILYFDGDDAGQFSTAAACRLLKPFLNTLKVAYPGPGLDPGTFTRAQNIDILSQAVDSDQWLFAHPQY